MTIQAFITCETTNKQFFICSINYLKGDSLKHPNILRNFRIYCINFKKMYSGFLRREHGFLNHNLKLKLKFLKL